MVCFHCKAEIPDDSAFCIKCGAKQDSPVCPSCGAGIIEGSRFCNKCGTRLQREIASTAAKKPAALNPKALKQYIYKIAALVLTFLSFVLAMLPIYSFDVGTLVGQVYPSAEENNLKVGYNAFDIIFAGTGLFEDKDSQAYYEELMELVNDRVDQSTWERFLTGQSLSTREKKDIVSVFKNYNTLKASFASDVRSKSIFSITMYLISALVIAASIVMPLIFLIFSILGLLKNRIYPAAKYSFITMTAISIALLFLCGSLDEIVTFTVFPKLYLFIAILGTAGTLAYEYLGEKKKINTWLIVKRGVSVFLSAFLIWMLSGDLLIISFESYNDRESYQSLSLFTNKVLDADGEYKNPQEINTFASSLSLMNYRQRRLIFSITNSLDYALNEDMEATYTAIIFLSAVIPILALGCFGLLLVSIVLNLIYLQNNQERDSSSTSVMTCIVFLLHLICIGFAIALILAYNESTNTLELDSWMRISVIPFFFTIFSVALFIFNIALRSKKATDGKIVYPLAGEAAAQAAVACNIAAQAPEDVKAEEGKSQAQAGE